MSQQNDVRRLMKQAFRSKFSERMRLLGFSKHTAGTYFCKTNFGRKGVTVFFNSKFGALQISASMSLKVDSLEELLFEYRTISEKIPLTSPNDFSVCEDLGNIKSNIFRWWNNYDTIDLDSCIAEIGDLIVEIGIPFLETIDTPDKLLDEMLKATKAKSKLGNPTFLYERAFLLMVLLDKPHVYPQFKPVFRAAVHQTGGLVVQQFDKFVEWLETRYKF